MKADLLTKLNAKIQNTTDVAGGFGGLEVEDISHALSGEVNGKRLPRGAINLAEAERENFDARRLLVFDLVTAIAENVEAKKGKPYLKILCDLAIHDEIGSNCHNCGGTGTVTRTIQTPAEAKHINEDGLLPVPCEAPHCINGRHKMTTEEIGREIAEAIGEQYTRYKWDHGWSWDYHTALGQIAEWRVDIERHLSQRMSE